jgi:hemolysin-activating ACP:hemolysin acyltransferase
MPHTDAPTPAASPAVPAGNALIGAVVRLVCQAGARRRYSVEDVTDGLLPPILLDQCRLLADSHTGHIKALATWGRFSEEAERAYLEDGRLPAPEEWRSGDRLYITDFIAVDSASARKLARDLKNNVFKHKQARAKRVRPAASAPRVALYRGARRRGACAAFGMLRSARASRPDSAALPLAALCYGATG